MTDTQQTQTSPSVPPVAEETMAALQTLIERQAERIDQLKQQIKAHADSMRSIMDNDTVLSEEEVKANEAAKQMKDRKKQLIETPEFKELRIKSVELKDEVKELEESLNTHLLNYYQQTGVKTFDTSSGAQREFRITARVLPKKEKHDNH